LAPPDEPQITNDVPDQQPTEIFLKARFVYVPSEHMQVLGSGWASLGNGTSLLSERQVESVIRALQERKGHLINEAAVTTANGRQAQLGIGNTVSIDGTNATAGEILDVVPYFSVNSSIFALNLAVQWSQLTGDSSRPDLLTIQVSNQVNVF